MTAEPTDHDDPWLDFEQLGEREPHARSPRDWATLQRLVDAQTPVIERSDDVHA